MKILYYIIKFIAPYYTPSEKMTRQERKEQQEKVATINFISGKVLRRCIENDVPLAGGAVTTNLDDLTIKISNDYTLVDGNAIFDSKTYQKVQTIVENILPEKYSVIYKDRLQLTRKGEMIIYLETTGSKQIEDWREPR